VKRILSIESFREVTLSTWDEHLDGAQRLSFSSPMLAEQHLRRFAEDPIALAALREFTAVEPTPSLGGEGVDAVLRAAGQRLFDKRLKLFERTLTKYFSDVPTGPSDVDPPDLPDDPDDPQHILLLEGDDPRQVDVNETLRLQARAEPPGDYRWTVVSGPVRIEGADDGSSVTLRGTAVGTATVKVRHTWQGDVKEAQATVRVVDYVFQWDAPHTTARKQYVNLPAAWDPPHNGKRVELVGHIEPRAPGKTVTFRLVPNPDNEPDTTASTLAALTATTDANGVARVHLDLSHYGGSRWKVEGKTASQPTAALTGELTVWRKVFYQCTDMASSPAPESLSLAAPSDMIPALRGAFDPVFFELAASTRAHDTTPYQAHLTAAQRTTLEGSLRTAAVDNRSPFKMNIVMCDTADIVAESTWTSNATTAIVQLPNYVERWPHEAMVISATYTDTTGAQQNLSNVQVVAHATNASWVFVRAEIPGFAPGSTVPVSIHYRYKRGNAGGWGGTTGTLFMCIGRQRRADAARPTGAELQQALTHEIGHALGLVAPGAAWHDPDPRDAGYSLRHCKYQDTATPPEPRCVMWFMLGGSGPRLRFCKDDRPDDCAHFLLRTDYASLSWI
jgi:hypothetical protein